MGDVLYYKNSIKTRLDLKLGNGNNLGKKVIPVYKNQAGEAMELPQFQNLIINLCKYSFLLNNTKSCSQYIDNSDLSIGKVQVYSGVKSITVDEFQGKFTNNEENFIAMPTNQYVINTNKGILFIKKDYSQYGLGFLLPNNKSLLSNEGDSFTLSYTFAYNDANSFTDMLQIIKNQSTINNDGNLRIERGGSNSTHIYYTKSSNSDDGKDGIDLGLETNDKIQNVILTAKREIGTNKLLITSFFNGIKKTDSQIMGTYRISPMDLICLNISKNKDKTSMNLFIFGLRLWDTALNDDEISILSKIEARNIGLEVFPENGVPLNDYLNS